MAKRYSDTDKWKKPFIRSMDTPYKLFWIYILDECDHAGIWQVDMAVAELKIGEKLEHHKALKFFSGKVIEICGGEKWFIPGFIEFQYGVDKLNPDNKVHTSIIKILSKYSLIDSEFRIVPSPIQAPSQGAKDKEKDKAKDKEKDKEKETAPPPIKLVTPHTLCKDFFITHQKENNRECNWGGRYASDMSDILKKLRVTYTKSNGKEPTDEQLVTSFKYMIQNLPGFFEDKNLSIINSSYDSIVNQIKNAKSTTGTGKRAGYTNEELLDGMEDWRRRNPIANS